MTSRRSIQDIAAEMADAAVALQVFCLDDLAAIHYRNRAAARVGAYIDRLVALRDELAGGR